MSGYVALRATEEDPSSPSRRSRSASQRRNRARRDTSDSGELCGNRDGEIVTWHLRGRENLIALARTTWIRLSVSLGPGAMPRPFFFFLDHITFDRTYERTKLYLAYSWLIVIENSWTMNENSLTWIFIYTRIDRFFPRYIFPSILFGETFKIVRSTSRFKDPIPTWDFVSLRYYYLYRRYDSNEPLPHII